MRSRKSAFNSRPGIAPALQAVIEGVKAPNLIVSFNDEGYLGRDQLVEMLSGRLLKALLRVRTSIRLFATP